MVLCINSGVYLREVELINVYDEIHVVGLYILRHSDLKQRRYSKIFEETECELLSALLFRWDNEAI